MPPTASLKPIAAFRFGSAEAQHLLHRAGFGGTPRQIAALADMGLDAAVDYLVDYGRIAADDLPEPDADPDLIRPPTPEEARLAAEARRTGDQDALDRLRAEHLARQGRDRQQMRQLESWWLARMIATPRPLEEKLTLLWHGHFASNHRGVDDSYLMLRQNAFFRANAAGSFADLALGIIRDPAMLKFLNNDSSRKLKPNENLARELMELFTLGEGQGYAENDIKDGARALTGYGVEDNDFAFHARAHDYAPNKRVLGQTGNFDGEGFVKLILARPECPRFVAGKLYRHFVRDLDAEPDEVSAAVIRGLAQALASSRYQLKPVLRGLFRSEHFYDDAVAGQQIKSPVQLVVGTARSLGTPLRDLALLADALGLMGQKLFDPPSVAGWHGGRGWINTSTLFVRQNLCAYLLTGKLPFDDGWSREKIEYDPMPLLEGLSAGERTPEAVAGRLADTLLGRRVAPQRRAELVAYLKARAGGVTPDALLAALLLITATPEYQLC